MNAVVALDLGGTHISAATIDLATAAVVAEARARAALPTGASREELLARIRDTAIAARSGDVGAASLAAPGPFDYARGICLLEHKLEPLHGADLRAELADALSLSPEAVRFLNDAEAFLLGEWWSGAARGHDRAVGITIGTGLGSAFLDRGTIVRDGPEVPPGGELYRELFRGAPVEERISRGALQTRYGDASIDVEEIARSARAGDDRALEAFDVVSSDLSEFLRPWLTAFRPSCVVVGGSITHAWDLLQPRLGPLAIVAPAEDVDDAALLGAARHAMVESAA